VSTSEPCAICPHGCSSDSARLRGRARKGPIEFGWNIVDAAEWSFRHVGFYSRLWSWRWKGKKTTGHLHESSESFTKPGAPIIIVLLWNPFTGKYHYRRHCVVYKYIACIGPRDVSPYSSFSTVQGVYSLGLCTAGYDNLYNGHTVQLLEFSTPFHREN